MHNDFAVGGDHRIIIDTPKGGVINMPEAEHYHATGLSLSLSLPLSLHSESLSLSLRARY
jgi:hypothetical protein